MQTTKMTQALIGGAMLALSMAAGGCSSSQPQSYERARPPVDRLDSRDRGLQSKDVVSASESMANDLLQNPELNFSEGQWKIVVGKIRNNTATARQDLMVFLQRLRVRLAQQSAGRVALIQNRDDFRAMQSAELEQGAADEFEQGAGTAQPGPAGIQPQYMLDCLVSDLPGRGTNYYVFEFQLTSLRDRRIVWTNMYEVKVER
jgi:PBP1b-binding outer membrane lipoprotein LpoB